MTPRDDLRRIVSATPTPRKPSAGTMRSGLREAAVLVLFGPCTTPAAQPADLDILLQRRAADLGHHPGQISFPGGGVDPGETTIEAALREAVEETGLDPHGVDVLGTLSPQPLAVSDNLVTPVLAWWSNPSPVSAVDLTETAEVFRIPIAELLDPQNRRSVATHVPTPGFVIESDIVIWGFTAMVLARLFDAAGWSQPWDTHDRIPIPA